MLDNQSSTPQPATSHATEASRVTQATTAVSETVVSSALPEGTVQPQASANKHQEPVQQIEANGHRPAPGAAKAKAEEEAKKDSAASKQQKQPLPNGDVETLRTIIKGIGMLAQKGEENWKNLSVGQKIATVALSPGSAVSAAQRGVLAGFKALRNKINSAKDKLNEPEVTGEQAHEALQEASRAKQGLDKAVDEASHQPGADNENLDLSRKLSSAVGEGLQTGKQVLKAAVDVPVAEKIAEKGVEILASEATHITPGL